MKKFIGLTLVLLTLLVAMDANAQRYYVGRGHHDGYYGYSYGYYGRDFYRYSRGYGGVSILASLPFGAIMVSIGGVNYHYYNGFYYRPARSGFIIVEPPIGVVIPSTAGRPKDTPASEYEKIVIEGKTYYKKGDNYYKAGVSEKGEIMYESVGQLRY